MDLRILLESKGFERFPLRKLNTTHYLLQAKINNIDARLILDTGASTTCINIHKAEHFNIKHEESEVKAAGAGRIGMDTSVSKNNKISFKKWNRIRQQIILFDLSHVNIALEAVGENPVDGILGADFLKKNRAIIDYGKNALYLIK